LSQSWSPDSKSGRRDWSARQNQELVRVAAVNPGSARTRRARAPRGGVWRLVCLPEIAAALIGETVPEISPHQEPAAPLPLKNFLRSIKRFHSVRNARIPGLVARSRRAKRCDEIPARQRGTRVDLGYVSVLHRWREQKPEQQCGRDEPPSSITCRFQPALVRTENSNPNIGMV
jgi:hypothetical protein